MTPAEAKKEIQKLIDGINYHNPKSPILNSINSWKG